MLNRRTQLPKRFATYLSGFGFHNRKLVWIGVRGPFNLPALFLPVCLAFSVAFAYPSVKGIAPMAIPEFVSGSRLMLIAPHPDDEALACSIIFQRAIQAGTAIRDIYATDGDDNPCPHRLLEQEWRLNSADPK